MRPTHLVGVGRLHMTLVRHLVLLFASDTILGSYILGCDTHRNEALLSLIVIEYFVGELFGVNLAHHVVHGHGFDTAADANLDLT